MDINLKRRRQEIAIADAVVEQLILEVPPSDQATPPEVLAHHFGMVCDRMAYVPTHDSTRRILAYACKGMDRKKRDFDQVQRGVDGLTAAAERFRRDPDAP
jgi:hypothetical protein